MDYQKQYFEQKDENEFLKEDIQFLRNKIEKLTRDNCSLKVDLELLKSAEMKTKYFSGDGLKAVSELLEILNESESYSYNEHKYARKSYYKIYNIDGLPIFVLENYTRGQSVHPGLLTTPEKKDINNDYKSTYDKVTSSWYLFANHEPRKQYDIRGKPVLEVMDILDQFR
tara:strand:- start:1201 stop:1710 length:510 start_codon:yes stop_codon:yes gene_type:complete